MSGLGLAAQSGFSRLATAGQAAFTSIFLAAFCASALFGSTTAWKRGVAMRAGLAQHDAHARRRDIDYQFAAVGELGGGAQQVGQRGRR